MIYLVKAAYLDETDIPRKCLKIGYAKDINNRMNGYGTSNNLNVILLDSREGDLGLEFLFHRYYKDKIIKIKGNQEWMEYDEKIIEDFKTIQAKNLFLNEYSSNSIESGFCNVIYNHFYDGFNLSLIVSLFQRRPGNDMYEMMEEFLKCRVFMVSDFEKLYEKLILLCPEAIIEKERFIEDLIVSLKDYIVEREMFSKDRFSVFNCIINEGINIEPNIIDSNLCEFNHLSLFTSKMKYLCELDLSEAQMSLFLDQIPLIYKNYYNLLGKDKIKSLGYRKDRLEAECEGMKNSFKSRNEVLEDIQSLYPIGTRVLVSKVKADLQEIYDRYSLGKVAKAKDLEKYYDVQQIRFPKNPETGKRDLGYEILSLKE